MQGAHGFMSACFLGEKIYGGIRLAAINAAKKDFISAYFLAQKICDGVKLAVRKSAIRYVDLASGKLAPLIKEYSSDIALGALVIAGSLVLFLVFALLH